MAGVQDFFKLFYWMCKSLITKDLAGHQSYVLEA